MKSEKQWLCDIYKAFGSVKTGDNCVVLSGTTYVENSQKPTTAFNGKIIGGFEGEPKIIKTQHKDRPAVGIYTLQAS